MLRWAAVLWASAALIPPQDPGTTSEELPSIRPIQGDLHLWVASKEKLNPLTESVRVNPKDRIGTRKDRLGLLVTQDGSLISMSDVEVGHDRGLALERTKDKLVVKLIKGKIILTTYETGLRVETPNGVIEGGRGSCVITVDGARTRVQAGDRMTFVNRLGTVTLEGGQESTSERGGKPSDPKPTDMEKATSDLATQVAPANLVKNPGFEDGMKDWGLESARSKEIATLESGVSHSGRNCVRLDVNDGNPTSVGGAWLGFKQNLGLSPGKRYIIGAYLRQEIRSGAVKAFLSIETQKGMIWKLDPSEKGWTRLGGVYTPDPQARGFRISIEAYLPSGRYDATFWADDFFVMELK